MILREARRADNPICREEARTLAGKHISLLVHLIWSTKGREPWIAAEWRPDLYSNIGGIMRNKNTRLLSAGGTFDHIHILASLPSTISIAELVNVVKSNSSRWVHKSINKARAFAWQEGNVRSV